MRVRVHHVQGAVAHAVYALLSHHGVTTPTLPMLILKQSTGTLYLPGCAVASCHGSWPSLIY